MTDKELKARVIGYRLYSNGSCWGTICNVVFHRNPANYCTIKTTSEGADDHSPRNTPICRDELEELCENRKSERLLEAGFLWEYELKPINKQQDYEND